MKLKLLEPTNIGPLILKNRIVMAPMTRSRAIGNTPNLLMAQYYSQRSTAGLIITEGTSPSPNGLGYARIPGLFTSRQAAGWRLVTNAVHAKGAKIFMQMMHTGRVSHVANLPEGAKVLAPSAIRLEGHTWTDQHQAQPYSAPHEMTAEEIEQTIQEFITSAKLAIEEAKFDGVEIHAANGYLIEQFLNPATNHRKDIYGNHRSEFALRIARGIAEAIGPDKVGIRISPYGKFNGMEAFEETDQFYAQLARDLSAIGLAYIHVIDHGKGEVKRLVRENFKGAYILSTGYDIEKAEAHLNENRGDLVAFGKPFISNPDFVERVRRGLPLRNADPATFYTSGAEGYTDYVNQSDYLIGVG